MAVQEAITVSAVEAVTAATAVEATIVTATVAVETMVKQGANCDPFTSC